MLSRRLMLMAGLVAVLAGCGKPQTDKNTLTVAATAIPHAEILQQIVPDLAAQGITLEVKVFNDYVQPNLQVDQGLIDANYFQHLPYLESFNRDHGTKLMALQGVHIEPFGGYSRKVKAISDLKQGAVIAIPNDPSNAGRALILLHHSGLIKLKDAGNINATVKDITENPKGFVIRELESPSLPRVLPEVDLALINTNYALDAGLDPQKDALIIEGSDSPYVNYLVIREDRAEDARLKALAAALASQKVKDFIAEKYKGAVLPAF
ncbi:MAG: MetQ/NlpA family ABC transporter substrate-binding protein [Asticcacaulis sp.]